MGKSGGYCSDIGHQGDPTLSLDVVVRGQVCGHVAEHGFSQNSPECCFSCAGICPVIDRGTLVLPCASQSLKLQIRCDHTRWHTSIAQMSRTRLCRLTSRPFDIYNCTIHSCDRELAPFQLRQHTQQPHLGVGSTTMLCTKSSVKCVADW